MGNGRQNDENDIEHNEHDSLLGDKGSKFLEPPMSPPPNALIEENKYTLGIGYMLAMGVCGTVLVALGSTLESLAEKCGVDATEVGTVFIARGSGAILGAIGSAKLYVWFQGSHVMTVTLLWITLMLIILPFNSSVFVLHVVFLFLGLGTAITDTGCQIMTRKIHGKAAGPWLGANTVAFGISGACVPIIEIFTTNIFWQYGIIAFIVGCVALLIGLGPNPESKGRLQGMCGC
jgi:predicted MFS family arabinose efflux permease